MSLKILDSNKEFKKYEDLDPTDVLKTAHATMDITVNENGNIAYKYNFKLATFTKRQVELGFDDKGSDLLKSIENWKSVKSKPICGGFKAYLYLWDRDPTSLKLSKTNPEDLNYINGIAIFRDSIRILPYGDAEDDWLELDKTRYMRSSKAISRKNLSGYISINQIDNPLLIDKSNREGFIENQAASEFRSLLQAVLRIAANEFTKDRDALRRKEPVSLEPQVIELEQKSNLTFKIYEEFQSLIQRSTIAGMVPVFEIDDALRSVSVQIQELDQQIKQMRQTITNAFETAGEQRDQLLSLASMGLAAERFTHEFARLTREASEILARLEKRSKPENTKDLEALNSVIDAIKNDVRALGPLFYVRRTTREKPLVVANTIRNAILLNEGQLGKNDIKYEVVEKGKLEFTMREGPLTQVFNNIIDNACYWLSRSEDIPGRKIKITIDAQDRTVIIADNGPGIPEQYSERIFDPFFTSKTNGRGLGLYITREQLAEKGIIIELLDEGKHSATFPTGAAFILTFPSIESMELTNV